MLYKKKCKKLKYALNNLRTMCMKKLFRRKKGKSKKEYIETLFKYLDEKEIKKIKRLSRKKLISFSESKMGVSPDFPEADFTQIETGEKDLEKEIHNYNKKIYEKVKKSLFRQFSHKAKDIVYKHIGPDIVGFDNVKRSVGMMLFSDEPIHILLLGDPGTGKTDILSSAAKLSPISSFGLGSGTSSVGLSVTIKGNEVEKGLLPLADEGLCAIDELNLMKSKDYAALYNAMEKGFVSYDKGGKHHQFDARIKLLATANPKGDKFKGSTMDEIKSQIPFESALLSRFNMIFLIKRPNLDEFKEISKEILRQKAEGKKKENMNDIEFLKGYIDYCQKIDVNLPSKYESEIVDFAAELKKKEGTFLTDITPRMILGFIRLVKASAKMDMRKQAMQADIDFVKEVIEKALIQY